LSKQSYERMITPLKQVPSFVELGGGGGTGPGRGETDKKTKKQTN